MRRRIPKPPGSGPPVEPRLIGKSETDQKGSKQKTEKQATLVTSLALIRR